MRAVARGFYPQFALEHPPRDGSDPVAELGGAGHGMIVLILRIGTFDQAWTPRLCCQFGFAIFLGLFIVSIGLEMKVFFVSLGFLIAGVLGWATQDRNLECAFGCGDLYQKETGCCGDFVGIGPGSRSQSCCAEVSVPLTVDSSFLLSAGISCACPPDCLVCREDAPISQTQAFAATQGSDRRLGPPTLVQTIPSQVAGEYCFVRRASAGRLPVDELVFQEASGVLASWQTICLRL